MAQIDCGISSILAVTSAGGSVKSFTYNGQVLYLNIQSSMFIPCTGINDVVVSAPVLYMVEVSPNEQISWASPMSLLAGLLCAYVFVIASLKKWW